MNRDRAHTCFLETLATAIGRGRETHLLIIESPYRSLLRPLPASIGTMHERHPEATLTVILPEFVAAHWEEYFLRDDSPRLQAGGFWVG